jgi:hypothetical protein
MFSIQSAGLTWAEEGVGIMGHAMFSHPRIFEGASLKESAWLGWDYEGFAKGLPRW